MDTQRRMQRIKLIEKMEKNPEFCEKLGIRNQSMWKPLDKKF